MKSVLEETGAVLGEACFRATNPSGAILAGMAQTPEPSPPHPGINPFPTSTGSLLQPGNYIWMKSFLAPQKL